MAMTPSQQHLLTKNRVYLVNTIILSEEFFAFLTADKSITATMKEEIEAHSKTNQGRIGKLLDFLPKRPAKAFNTLLRALVETDQEHVAHVLDKNRTIQLVKSRDKRRDIDGSDLDTPVQQSSSDKKCDPSPVVPSTSNIGQSIQHTVPTLPPSSASGINMEYNGSPGNQGHVSGNSSNFQPSGSISQPAAVGDVSSSVGMQPTTPQQQDPQITLAEDEVDIVKYLATEFEGLDIVTDISSEIRRPQAIKNGMVVLICMALQKMSNLVAVI